MKKTSPAYVLLFMVLISIVFGTAIALVHYSTLPLLERNEQLQRNRVLAKAFLLPVKAQTADAYGKVIDSSIAPLTLGTGQNVRTLYQGPQETIGYEFSGMGFWDKIVGVIVLSSDLSTVVNIQFMDQKETPGLGARIEEQWFTDQFKGKTINWSAPENQRIVIGNLAGAPERSRVDAITGATQTSMALMSFLNTELAILRTLWLEQKENPSSEEQ